MEIDFQGVYKRSQVFRGVAIANKPSWLSTFFRITIGVVASALIIIFFATVETKYSDTFLYTLCAGRHYAVISIICTLFFYPSISSYSTATNLWQNPLMRKPMVGTISNQGIAYDSKICGRTEISWEGFSKIRMTDDLLILLTVEGTLVIFPRGFFKSESDWTTVRKVAEHKVVEAK